MRSQKHSPRVFDLFQEMVLIPKTSFCTPQKEMKTPRPIPAKDVTSLHTSKLESLEKELEESQKLNRIYAEKINESEFKVKELKIELEKAYINQRSTEKCKKSLMEAYDKQIFEFHQIFLESVLKERGGCSCKRREQISIDKSQFQETLHDLFTDV